MGKCIKGINDLETYCKNNNMLHLLKEWHPLKNGNLKPCDVASGSEKRVWWIVEYDDPNTGKHYTFEWETAVAYRITGQGCPYLSNPARAIYIGFNDLESTHPLLSKEWDYEKNGDLTPRMVSKGSNKKVWWICEKGHSFDASVVNRAKGRGCPFCKGKQVLKGFNDLATTNPDLVKEWDYEKNGKIRPDNISKGSAVKIWWKCAQNHSFASTIPNRVNANVNCPYCSERTVVVGKNDLATLYPEIANEWDYEKNDELTPRMVTKGSNKKVWWICEKGHSYDAPVASRTSGSNCPYCNGKRVDVGRNDLATLLPEIANEWDYNKNEKRIPQNYKSYSKERVWWVCKNNHSYELAINERNKGLGCPFCSRNDEEIRKSERVYYECEHGHTISLTAHLQTLNEECPYCGGKIVSLLSKSLEKTMPELAKEWDNDKNGNISPRIVPCGSNKTVWWKCKKGHSWNAPISSRALSNRGCPYCSGRNAIQGENDLETTDPLLAAEWNHEKNGRLTPKMFLKGSGKRVWWKCKKGHEWQATIAMRASGTGCPYCSGRYAITGENDLLTLRPDLENEWDYTKNNNLNPNNLLPGSNKKVWWICAKGHSYYSTINNRTQGLNCPYCSGQRVLAGYNDLATTHPDLVKEWDYEKNDKITPQMISRGSNTKVWWRCSNNHSYKASVGHRVDGRKCPICIGKKILQGYNDLATTHPQLASEWDYEMNGFLTPNMVSKGLSKKVWWHCINGHSYQTDILSRTSGYGCPYCSTPAKKVLSGYNDLKTKYPEIAKEWHPTKNGKLLPSQVLGGSNKKAWWLCGNGHEWQAVLNSRTSNNTGCPLCSGSKTERLIYDILSRNNFAYDEEKKFRKISEVKNYPFDVYLPNERIIIEADGIQHFTDEIPYFESVPFKKRVKHDNIKNEFCAGKYNDEIIPIIRIPYIYDPDSNKERIEQIILDFIKNRIVPQQIIDFYKDFKESIGNNYYEIATYINENMKKTLGEY